MLIRIVQNGIEKEYTAERPMPLLRFLQEQKITDLESPCGGRGTCRKCRVKIELGRQIMNPLACQIRICNGMKVFLPDSAKAVIAEDGLCTSFTPDPDQDGWAVACDIGTTTVVCHLVDLKTGQKKKTAGELNAQKVYGADVVSRIQSAAEGRLEEEHQAISGQLSRMIVQLWKDAGNAGLPEIRYMAAVGNTVMEHLLADLSPVSIGKAPFHPLSCFGSEMTGEEAGIRNVKRLYLAPAVSGYVGGDITSDLLAVKANTMEASFLLLDIGTNGEMVIGNKDHFWCCAAAAGPAFEGSCIEMGMTARTGAVSGVKAVRTGSHKEIQCRIIGGGTKAVGICGSGLIDALAVLLENGILDETGRFSEECPEHFKKQIRENEKGEDCFYLTDEVYISRSDIQQLQLAKAAVAAGIQILLKESGIQLSQISKMYLAGGFGSFLNAGNAAAIGLFPAELLPAAKAVGNAAGEGAVAAAISAEARNTLAEIKEHCHYIELSTHPDFTDLYLENMFFQE